VTDEVLLPDGRRVRVWQGGAARGPMVVFMHGCPDSRWAAWLGDAPARRTGVRLEAVNRPGYGSSDAHASTPESVGDDTAAVADALGAATFGILGMSVGGVHALATATRHPHRVTGLVTVSAPGQVAVMDPPRHREGLSPEQADRLDDVRTARSVEEAVELLRPEYEAFLSQMRVPRHQLAARWLALLAPTERALLGAVPDSVLERQAREALGRPEGYLRDAAAMFRPWAFDPADVRCPVTVVHGGRDTQASLRHAHWLAAHLPAATLVERPRATHLGALHEHWDAALEELRRAAGGQADRSTSPDS